MVSPSKEITELLLAWSKGDQTALEQLIPLVHEEMRRLAKRYMRGCFSARGKRMQRLWAVAA